MNSKQPSVQSTSKWIPYVLPWDDAPLDLSFLYEDEKPAGKHGFLSVKGEKLVFEDETEARFWGTCFNSAANFPSHEYSEKVARRLAKFGVNIVRTHQMDAEWSTPNIFQCTRGRGRDDSQTFDPESMERLDYLIHCLKREGIYIYLDLLTYREFKPGDGVDAVTEFGPAAKPYTCFDRRLIELQKKFCLDLWTHVNPYTDLAYKDEPAIVLTEIANENDVFHFKVLVEPYRTRLEQRYRTWAKLHGMTLPAEKIDFSAWDETMVRFLHDVQQSYYGEIYSCLREIGVRIPIAGTNWECHFAELSASTVCDFRDNHFYWDMWSDVKGNNTVMMAEKTNVWAAGCARTRLLDRPFVVSEWDQVWPNEWRGESPLMVAALGSFQGWNGIIIHTYRYRTCGPLERMGGVVMYGVGYRVNFDTYNDPAKFGLFYHAALLFRRSDVAPARKTVAVQLTEKDMFSPVRIPTPALAALSEIHKAGTMLPGQSVKVDEILSVNDAAPETDGDGIFSDTRQMYRNPRTRISWIDTPFTKAAYGFLGEAEQIKLDGLVLKVSTPFAVIAISSLTNEPISKSAHMLMTTVGRADNTNAKYNEPHTERLYLGDAPIVVEVIEAVIEIETKHRLRVFAIDREGFLTGRVPACYEAGKLVFEVGKVFPSMYYLLQV